MSKIYQTIILWVIGALCIGIFGCKRTANDPTLTLNNKEIIFDSNPKDIKFTIEVFDTEASRARGLMFRRSMPKDHGGFFVFPNLRRHVFWMKNTYLSLDLIFFDNDLKVVGTIENTVPLSLERIGINEKSRYVLEVLAGTVKEYGIDINAKAHLTGEQ